MSKTPIQDPLCHVVPGSSWAGWPSILISDRLIDMHTVARQSRDDMKHILYPFSNCAKLGTQEHYLFLPRGRFRGHRREEHALRTIGVPSTGDPNSPGGTAGWVAMVSAT